MKRITKAALGGLAGCALILGASQAANSAPADITYLLDKADTGDFALAPETFDDAEGTLRVVQSPDDNATGFKLTVEKIAGAAGQEFGAHLHTGRCVDGDLAGSLAGPHYTHPGVAPNLEDVEVWFDLVPNDHGVATDDTKKNFVPVAKPFSLESLPGEMSIVIHALPTNTEFGFPTADQKAGYAGARWACFQLLTPWAP